METNRRRFLQSSLTLAAGIGLAGCSNQPANADREIKKSGGNKIGVSTYSFWQFNGPKENVPIEMCIDKAAEFGFDGIEFLLMQMTSEENSYLQNLKRRVFHAGLDIMGFSTHQ